jgi:acetyltransferase-like isoleucine patch superfamily enzyme
LNPFGLISDARAVLNARYHLRSAQAIGPRVRLWGTPSIRNQGRLVVGNRVRLYSTVAMLELGIAPGGSLEIGDRVMINYGTSIGVYQSVRIGNRCNIGTHVMLIDNSFHHLDPERRNEAPPSEPIVLEENVWLAARVIVLPGVTIGRDSVVGAGSVVTRDIPPGVLAAGVPARVLRPLSSSADQRG